MESITHWEFSLAWSAFADAEYVNQNDIDKAFTFLRRVHEVFFINTVDICSLCEKEHGQQGAPYKNIIDFNKVKE